MDEVIKPNDRQAIVWGGHVIYLNFENCIAANKYDQRHFSVFVEWLCCLLDSGIAAINDKFGDLNVFA